MFLTFGEGAVFLVDPSGDFDDQAETHEVKIMTLQTAEGIFYFDQDYSARLPITPSVPPFTPLKAISGRALNGANGGMKGEYNRVIHRELSDFAL